MGSPPTNLLRVILLLLLFLWQEHRQEGRLYWRAQQGNQGSELEAPAIQQLQWEQRTVDADSGSALSSDPVQDPSQGVGFQWWAFVYQINLCTKPWQEPQGLISQMMLDLLSWQSTTINTPTNYISTIFRKLNGVINFLSECGPGGWNMLPWMATHSTVRRQH